VDYLFPNSLENKMATGLPPELDWTNSTSFTCCCCCCQEYQPVTMETRSVWPVPPPQHIW